MSLVYPGATMAQKKIILAENRYVYSIEAKMVVSYNSNIRESNVTYRKA